LYKYAKEILSLYATAEKAIGELTGFVKGGICIGASSTIGNYLLPGVIADFKKTHSKINICLLVGNTKRIVELLNSGNIDLGLVEGEVTRQKMQVDKLITDELLLVVPAHHPWARKKEVSISELTKEPFILREGGSGTRQMIEKFLCSYGVSIQDLKISMLLGSTEAIKAAVENGLGVSIISRWSARKEIKYGTLCLLRIKGQKMARELSLITNKGAISSHAVDEFLTYVKSYPFEKLLC
ncbi:MAG: LysR family transcriptional regulator, partial [Nitrospira bacterium HGW-Nitrospira-1]